VPLPLILSVGLFESDKYFEKEASDHKHDHDHHDHAHAHDHHDHDHDCGHDHHEHGPDCGHDHHDHDHHHHSNHLENDGFTSLSFESDKPFAIKKFQYFLDSQLPGNVFRAKGILWFDESPNRHIFHLSGKRFTIEDDEWNGKPKKTQLVLIGQNLDHDKLRSQIEHCVCIPSSNRGKGFGK
jgi:G3E family GTPase